MLHDGSWVRLRKIAEDFDPTDRDTTYAYIRERQKAGEVATGLLYLSPDSTRHARTEQHRGDTISASSLQRALSWRRRAGKIAKEIQILSFV